jgi:predicted permease
MLNTLLIMGSMLGIGALLNRKVGFHEDTRNLFASLIIYVAVPSLVFVSFLKTPHEPRIYIQLLWMFLFSIGIYIVTLFFTIWIASLFNITRQRANELAVIAAHGNTGFIGLPLCAALFGSKGVILAIAFDEGVGVCFWTISAMVLQNRISFSPQILKSVFNFPLIAIGLGLSFYLFEL